MSAAHVRRGGGGRAQTRKPAAKVTVPKKIAKRLPVDHARANKLAGIAFGGLLLAIGAVVIVALDIPAKAERTPAKFDAFVKAEIAKWSPILKQASATSAEAK